MCRGSVLKGSDLSCRQTLSLGRSGQLASASGRGTSLGSTAPSTLISGLRPSSQSWKLSEVVSLCGQETRLDLKCWRNSVCLKNRYSLPGALGKFSEFFFKFAKNCVLISCHLSLHQQLRASLPLNSPLDWSCLSVTDDFCYWIEILWYSSKFKGIRFKHVFESRDCYGLCEPQPFMGFLQLLDLWLISLVHRYSNFFFNTFVFFYYKSNAV